MNRRLMVYRSFGVDGLRRTRRDRNTAVGVSCNLNGVVRTKACGAAGRQPGSVRRILWNGAGMVRRPGIRGRFEDLPEEQVAELERMFKEAGFRVGVSGYDQVLVEEAERAASRAQSALEKRDSGAEAGAAAAAILCSSAACESRLSEYLAHYEFASGPLPEELRRVKSNRNARQQWRDLLRFLRPDFDLGTSAEYRRLGCLFQLRDLVAHRNAKAIPLDTLPEGIEPCVRQRVIPVRRAENVDWTSIIFVAEVARWSARVAREWMDKADELAPFIC